MAENKKRSMEGYKFPIFVLVCIYLGLFFIADYVILEHNIDVANDGNRLIIKVEKKQ